MFVNPSKITCKSVDCTRLCGVAQCLLIAIVLGICGLERINKHFWSYDVQRVLYLVVPLMFVSFAYFACM